MGRHAYIPRLGRESGRDIAAAREAMRRTGVEALAENDARALSGGEWQRVLIARALAQESGALLLDEPVANLDIRYQLEILRLLRALAQEGRAVVLVMHDINLAARFCDRLAVLRAGRLCADGAPADVLTPQLIEEVYGVRGTRAAIPIPVSNRIDAGNGLCGLPLGGVLQACLRSRAPRSKQIAPPSGGESRRGKAALAPLVLRGGRLRARCPRPTAFPGVAPSESGFFNRSFACLSGKKEL